MIERIFGVLKRRFRALKTPMEYPYETQVKLVLALCGLQNFIRRVGGSDQIDADYNIEQQREELERDRARGNDAVVIPARAHFAWLSKGPIKYLVGSQVG